MSYENAHVSTERHLHICRLSKVGQGGTRGQVVGLTKVSRRDNGGGDGAKPEKAAKPYLICCSPLPPTPFLVILEL